MIGRFMSAVFVYSQFKEAKTFSHKDGTCTEHSGGNAYTFSLCKYSYHLINQYSGLMVKSKLYTSTF